MNQMTQSGNYVRLNYGLPTNLSLTWYPDTGFVHNIVLMNTNSDFLCCHLNAEIISLVED